MKRRVNYFDLGLHTGLELNYILTHILTPLENKKLIDFQVYGFEASEKFALRLKEQYHPHPELNTTIVHKAISNTEDKIKLYRVNLKIQPNEVGNSIFRTKNNVTDDYVEVEGIIFSKWLKENVPSYKDDINIM